MTHGRAPRGQEHVDGRYGPSCGPLAAHFVRRHHLAAQFAADRAGNRFDLLALGQLLRSGQNIFGAGVPMVTERADGDCSYVALIDGRGRNIEVWPAHHAARANLWTPPVTRV